MPSALLDRCAASTGAHRSAAGARSSFREPLMTRTPDVAVRDERIRRQRPDPGTLVVEVDTAAEATSIGYPIASAGSARLTRTTVNGGYERFSAQRMPLPRGASSS
jgi:hypothetical protein